ncbi:hypothetical protein [Marinobacter sp. HN1S83]|uniref:hypothetical protein n=1 Tax=Marinobacter sp. HN1S83 TaxID=3382301 RepID=UPI00387AC3BC
MEPITKLYEALQSEDDLGAVVRSHIIIEQRLNKFVEAFMVSTDHLRRMKLDFHQTVKLAVALGLNERFEAPLNSLGTLRNGFAHSLRPEISKQDANNLYKSFSATDKAVLQSSLKHTQNMHPENALSDYRVATPKEQFSLNVVVLCAAVESAMKKIPNQ